MARDPMRVLLTVRRHAVEAERRTLAGCVAEQAAIAARIAALDDAMLRDRDAAAGWDDAYRFLELAPVRRDAWLADRRTLVLEADAAACVSQAGRDRLAAARTASESVVQSMSEREAERRAEAIRREQHELDDVARALPAKPRTHAGERHRDERPDRAASQQSVAP